MNKKIRVAVVFGGASSEHEISCATAAGVLSAIDRDQFEVFPIGITRTGEWILAGEEVEKLRLDGEQAPQVTGDDGAAITVGLGQGAETIVTVDAANG